MLNELQEVRQIPGEGGRRWFKGREMELIVWYRDEACTSAPTGFQLCYDLSGAERALTWSDGSGYSHTRIDTGERPFSAKMTPILVQDGTLDTKQLRESFDAEASNLEPSIVELVREKIRSYG